ncbi:NCS2 family permease [Alkaliphilus sp. B6464]|uniref:NCS2 family permease n=1 Tax=Alkaliphilus sp. B6464 TaxID=2731219 RepID=UPI001BA74DCD|nr:NCS2 family permease [Alkaliphilus sp. B6464]QUH18602.1 NCS2 family permease [Alkaliphilus sp. B6464]
MEIKKYPWFIKEDIDAFFALFQNNLANFVVIAITMISIGYPADIVYGKVIPGAAISVLFGNFYYAHMASKLSVKENRLDVTALSYGISTPVMFIYLFGVMKPALDFTGDPQIAWKIGVAACFLGGVVESLGSLVGTWIKNNLPRASMLGALAGVAFSVIGGQMFFHTYEAPIIGIFVLAIILVGLVAKKQMPFKIPASLFAIIIGTVLAYTFREANIGQVTEGLANVGFYPPLPSLTFIEGLQYLFGPMIGLLAVLLPISIYNFIETMNNVEAMSAAGDNYNVAEAQLFDGVGTMIGALFGGVFPTTVYIASVSAKWTNAGRGYSIINGLVFLLASTFGIIAAMSKIIPLPVVAPILVFVGISMVSQAFSSVEEKHYPAVVLAMIPYLANYLQSKFASLAPEALDKVSPAIIPLGQGAMFTALIWGAILVFILDNEFKKASVVSFIGAILSAIGLIHAPKLSLFFDYKYALAYLIIGIAFIILNVTLKDSEDESQLQKNLMVD